MKALTINTGAERQEQVRHQSATAALSLLKKLSVAATILLTPWATIKMIDESASPALVVVAFTSLLLAALLPDETKGGEQ